MNLYKKALRIWGKLAFVVAPLVPLGCSIGFAYYRKYDAALYYLVLGYVFWKINWWD